MNEATLDFIRQHADDDVRRLALQGAKNPEVDLTWALDQIAGRQQARTKLPTWAATDGIIYPPHLSMEQCSSEQAARYKANILSHDRPFTTSHSRLSLIDLTGGFGVDFAFMAQAFSLLYPPTSLHLTYVEQNEQLCRCAAHNFPLLGIRDVQVVCGDATEVLRKTSHATVVYMDPARRDRQGARTYDIRDCMPNVLALKEELKAKADCVLLKLSPMLDWRKAVSDLGQEWVREVHIVSVGNECKELLVVLKGEKVEEDALRVVCVNIAPSKPLLEAPSKPPPVGEAYGAQTFHYGVVWSDGADKKLPLQGEVLALQATKGQAWRGLFLYEPNASIMKAGCFDALSVQYGLSPLSANSHLFISPDSIENFPGRSFQISAVSSINKRDLKDALAGIRQANITVRNFPMSVADIRRRLKLADGGDTYLFATTLADGSHVLLICQKVSRTLKKDKASQNNCEL